MTVSFSCDLNGRASLLPHFWEHTVGSGHATLALRADWQAQMKVAHDELGMDHVRFHGILDDDMGTLIGEGDTLFYSFFNTDQIFDFLLSIGMKPFVELSFMPSILASGEQTVFHYKANVSPPRDLAQWAVLIRKLVSHWVDRYSIAEVRQWFFEVWNEPNLTAFGTGKQSDYFELYRYTVEAIKSVDNKEIEPSNIVGILTIQTTQLTNMFTQLAFMRQQQERPKIFVPGPMQATPPTPKNGV